MVLAFFNSTVDEKVTFYFLFYFFLVQNVAKCVGRTSIPWGICWYYQGKEEEEGEVQYVLCTVCIYRYISTTYIHVRTIPDILYFASPVLCCMLI